ncbi:MAG: hypothetical protein PHU98_10930, partial [Mariniphaga sp.]|nr:hypothetical protein [Mariniphaga sp.]
TFVLFLVMVAKENDMNYFRIITPFIFYQIAVPEMVLTYFHIWLVYFQIVFLNFVIFVSKLKLI